MVGSVVLTLSVTCADVALALKMAAPSDLSLSFLWCDVIPDPGFPFSRSLEILSLRQVISGRTWEAGWGAG